MEWLDITYGPIIEILRALDTTSQGSKCEIVHVDSSLQNCCTKVATRISNI